MTERRGSVSYSRFTVVAGAVPRLVLILPALLFLRCSAPRLNPLDPSNPSGNASYLDGTVLSDSRTPTPLEGVAVRWGGTSTYAATGTNGKFTLSLPRSTNGWVIFSKNSYVTDSVFIDWSETSERTITQYLHEIPLLDSFGVWSIVRNKYSGIEYGLETQVTVDDELEIDSVFLVSPALGIRAPLERLTATSFHASYLDFELGISSLNDAIGRVLSVEVKEQTGARFTVGSQSITRIIDQEIETISPKNQDTVRTLNPALRWKRFVPGFRFSYKVELYTNETEPKLVWSRSALSSDSVSTVVSSPVPISPTNDGFYWVISCVDEFNNINRCKPASFICDTTSVTPNSTFTMVH